MATFLGSSDAFVWSIGADPRFRSTIVTLILLGSTPDLDSVVDRFAQISRVAPMFRQRVVPSPWPVPPRWEPDPEFDLTFHLRRVGAPSPGDLDGVLELARLAVMADFDSAHPLWEATLIEGMTGGQAALLCRMNHALTDGVGAVEIGRILFDDMTDGPQRPTRRESGLPRAVQLAGHALSTSLRMGRSLVLDAVSRPVATVSMAGSLTASMWRITRPRRRRSPMMQKRGSLREVFMHEVSKQALHSAAAGAGGTLNDGFLAAVSAGLRRYHAVHGVSVDDLAVMMPMNLRTAGDQVGGNRTTLMRFDLPTGPADSAAHVQKIHELTSAQRTEKAVPVSPLIAGALNVAPDWYVRSLLQNVDFLASDVPGFPRAVTLAGAAVYRQYAFAPTLGTAVNVTLLSYGDVCTFGINVDTAAIPDVEVFRDCLIEGFDEVLALGA